MNTAPGWYPDPGGPPLERYWHGAGWTDQTRARRPAPAETQTLAGSASSEDHLLVSAAKGSGWVSGTTEVALLDRVGVIVAVNGAWEAFSRDNDGDPARTGVGMSYLQVCTAAAGDAAADQAAAAIRAALAGDLPAPLSMQIPCDAPNVPRWFDLLVSSRMDDRGRCVGATVTLSRTVATTGVPRSAGESHQAVRQRTANVVGEDLYEGLASIARSLDTGSVHETLQLIVDLALVAIPGCEHAGISVANGRKIDAPAASDAVALRLDAVQLEVDQGPCLDAISQEQIVRSDDLATDTRWPLFAARASAETGVTSVLGLRLFARGRTMGALNLLSSQPAAFGDDALSIGALFAALAAVALNAAQTEESLQLALKSRDVIGQAMGIMMERHRITDKQAFQRLSVASQNLNVRLKDVAQQVVLTGEDLPE